MFVFFCLCRYFIHFLFGLELIFLVLEYLQAVVVFHQSFLVQFYFLPCKGRLSSGIESLVIFVGS